MGKWILDIQFSIKKKFLETKHEHGNIDVTWTDWIKSLVCCWPF